MQLGSLRLLKGWVILGTTICFLLCVCNNSSFVSSGGEKKKTKPIQTTDEITIETNEETPATNTDTDIVIDDSLDPVNQDPCEVLTNRRAAKTIVFENPGVCNWTAPGNTSSSGSGQYAIQNQAEEIDVPKTAKICDMRIDFEKQAFWFDDDFYFLFNGYILASSLDYSAGEVFEKKDGVLMKFDWERVRSPAKSGQPYDESMKIQNYCLGVNEGLGSCSITPTETTGTIKIDIDKSIVKKMGTLGENSDKFEFSFVTTGNCNSTDCQHSEIKFIVTVDYVIQ